MSESPMLPFEEPEEWRDVIGYEGLYRVSDLGRVQSLPRPRVRARILKQHPVCGDYLTVYLYLNGRPRRIPVHVLVLQAFKGPRPQGMFARHGPNGNQDNRASQLCWGTRRENEHDKVRDGTLLRGERNASARLTEVQVREIRKRCSAGESQELVAQRFDIERGTVGKIVRRERWAHVA